MTDIPVIMSAPMVQATLREIEHPATGKTQTRRLRWTGRKAADGIGMRESPWARCKPDDRLWVRESLEYKLGMWWYAADGARVNLIKKHQAAGIAWAHHYSRNAAPSIHMPRACSRLTLHVTAVKIERLHMIRRSDIVAEGVPSGIPIEFTALWDSLHGSGAWDANPEIVAITFRPVLANIDAPEAQAA